MAMGNHKNAKHTYLPFFHLQADFSDVQYKNVGIFGFATSIEGVPKPADNQKRETTKKVLSETAVNLCNIAMLAQLPKSAMFTMHLTNFRACIAGGLSCLQPGRWVILHVAAARHLN